MEYSIGIIIYGNLLLITCMSFLMAASLLAAEIPKNFQRKEEEPQEMPTFITMKSVVFPLTNASFSSTFEKVKLNQKKASLKLIRLPTIHKPLKGEEHDQGGESVPRRV